MGAYLLLGYDIETSGKLTESFLERANQIHLRYEVPCTFFVTGQVVEENLSDLLKVSHSDLFDLQQHTYSHIPLKTVIQENQEGKSFYMGASLEEIYHEVENTSRLLKEYLGAECVGLTGPFGYYQGLSDRPDILEILHKTGIRFTRTYGRNHRGWQPVPFNIQPFWYELQGFPDILEFPVQGWQDILWLQSHDFLGYQAYLKSEIDHIAEDDLTWGCLQHDKLIDWDPDLEVTEGLIRYAKERGVRITSYFDYYLRKNRELEEEDYLLRIKRDIHREVIRIKKQRRRVGRRKKLKILTFRVGPGDIQRAIDDSVEALRRLGHRVETMGVAQFGSLEFQRVLIATIETLKPNFVFTINYLGLEPQILTSMKIPYISWFRDDPLTWIPRELLVPSEYAYIFTWDMNYLGGLKNLGFNNLFHLPLAAGQEFIKKGNTSNGGGGSDLSFVASSYYGSFLRYLQRITQRDPRLDMEEINEIANIQNQNSLLNISDIIEGYPKIASLKDEDYFWEIKRYIELKATINCRIEVIKTLSPLDLSLYGDMGWKELVGVNSPTFKHISSSALLPKLYSESKINLNITEVTSKTGINQKVYDVLASGGFLLTDFRRDLNSQFKPEEEIVYYRDKEELLSLIEYFLVHPKNRQEIALTGRDRVLREHTYTERMKKLIDIVKNSGIV